MWPNIIEFSKIIIGYCKDTILKKINAILARLEKQSILEKSRLVDVSTERRMLAITPDTARFYHRLLMDINAQRILELGTSSGYSTLWFANAVLQNGNIPKIITLEGNPVKVQMAKSNFEKAGVSKFIKIMPGQILAVLKSMPKRPIFDFILIDADKENVVEYFDLVLPMLKIGGVIGTDNVLLPQKYRRFMRKYSAHIRKNDCVVTGTMPIGYGQEITVKIH
jgi:predicted O-methyltransferase YrrM